MVGAIRNLFADGEKNEMNEVEIGSREKVKALLKELFQFDVQDLDFGIYRIMNFKRKEIEKFIEEDLIKAAEEEFKEYARVGMADLQKEVERLRSEIIRDFGEGTIDEEGNVRKHEDAPKIKEYQNTIKELGDAKLTQAQIDDVFNCVYEFFSRYYDHGDFISKRRYGGRAKYHVPHNGEEILFHWVNNDQYYIKSGEFFKKYTFRAGGYSVNFKLKEPETEFVGIKGEKKYFLLCDDAFTLDERKKELDVFFNWRALVDQENEKYGTRNVQEAITSDTVKNLLSEIGDKGPGTELRKKFDEEETLLEKHLKKYVEKNTADYFIHKNLELFLERELEFYIKNEVLDLDEIENMDERRMRLSKAKIHAITKLIRKVIEFLAQIEDFQKMLFEKKKLVLRTDYVITLDKIKEYTGEQFLESILDEVLRNSSQTKEWKELFGINFKNKGDLIERQALDEKEWKRLPIDTKHFSQEFKIRLMGRLSENNDLDETLDGIVIKSDNLQALSLLLSKYQNRVKTIYIDPPYNTGSDEFLYKDNYQHSCWLSMMNDRLALARKLMSQDGVLFTHIDENEQFRLRLLLDSIFEPDNYIAPFVWPSRSGRGGTVAKIQIGHEYIECITRDKQQSSFKPTVKEIEAGNYSDEKGAYRREPLRQWGPQARRREDRPSMYFPIPTPYGVDAYPKLPDGSDGRWRFGLQKVKEMLDEGDLDFFRDEKTGVITVYRKIRVGGKTFSAPSNILDDVGSSADGTKEILSLFGEKVFDTCKPLKLAERLIDLVTWEDKTPVFVLDFFAGSGTTAHAVLELNKQDGGRRKFILVELADFFDSVTLARLKKVSYSFDWDNGRPQSTKSLGIFFKYHYIEQYEDTLNNIVFREKDKTIQETLESFHDYFLHYMLDYETRESPTRLTTQKFETPFDYKIKTINGTEEKEQTVDLVETFNYLLGLNVSKVRTFNNGQRIYHAVYGKRDNHNTVIIWRNTKDLDLQKDKEFIEEKILSGNTYDLIFINGDSYVKNAQAIEPEFNKLMGA